MEEMDLEYTLIEGENTDEMMRQREYIPFAISDKQRLVFICNEEGNATYIVESEDPEGGWEQYAGMTKDELREMRSEVGGVDLVGWSGESESWKEKVRKVLEIDNLKKLKERKTTTNKEKKDEPRTESELAPEGWKTKNSLEKLLGRSYQFIEKNINELRDEHPDWIRDYRGRTGRILEHYSPEMIEAVKTELESTKKAPEGWMTKNSIAKLLGVNYRYIENKIDRFRDQYPSWIGKFRDKSGHKSEHYSPEMIEKIKEELEKQRQ